MWIAHTTRDQRAVARELLVAAGAALLRRPKHTITVGRLQSGQPWLRAGAETALQVSVSHCREAVVVAASRRHPVGVDIESRRAASILGPSNATSLRLAERWFDPTELAWLRQAPPASRGDAFLMLWTAKEAVGKALGIGLRHAGLRRAMPLPELNGPAAEPRGGHAPAWLSGSSPAVRLRGVPDHAGLLVGHPAPQADAVLAVALFGSPDTPITVIEPVAHDRALRSDSGLRANLPVVVRGN